MPQPPILTLKEVVQDPDFQWLPEQEKFAAFKDLGPQDPEWIQLPNDQKIEIMAAAGIKLAVSAYNRKKEMEAGRDIPPNVNLATPKDTSYLQRMGRRVQEGATEFTTPPSDPNLGVMQMLQGAHKVVTAPVTAGIEKGIRGAADDSVAGPELEEVTQGGAEFAENVLETVALGGIGGKKIAKAKIVNPEKELPLMQSAEGKTIELNKPPSVPEQEMLNESLVAKGVLDPGDIQSTAAKMAAEKGVPPPDVTVGQTPISKSQTGPGGKAKIDLAEGAPYELEHELRHVEADVKGIKQPPEDNSAIVQDRLKKGAMFENRGRSYIVESYDPELGTYRVKDQKTGMRTDFNEESVHGPAPKPPPGAAQAPPPPTGPPTIPAGAVPAAPPPPVKPPAAASAASAPAAKQHNIVWRVANEATRIWQAAAASLSGPQIIISGGERTLGHAILQTAAEHWAKLRKFPTKGDPWEGFKMLTSMKDVKGNTAIIKMLRELDPKAVDRFLVEGPLETGGGKVAQALSIFNKLGDLVVRTGVSVQRLRTLLEQRGLNLDELVKTGKLSEVTADELANALHVGNEYAFSLEPVGKTMAAHLVNLFRNPYMRTVGPFPRIVYNKLRTAVKTSPTLMFKYMKPENALRLAKGDPAAAYEFGMGVIGSAMVAAGWEMDEKSPDFLTVKITKNMKLDLKHELFNPWFAVGALSHRLLNPVASNTQYTEDVLSKAFKAVVGAPGAGYALLEPIADAISKWAAGEPQGKSMNYAESQAQRWLGAFAQPLQGVKMLVAAFDDEEKKYRDISQEGILGSVKEKIPFVGSTMPEQHIPEKEDPLKRGYPLANLLGIQLQEANTPVQDEIMRLDVRVQRYPFSDKEANAIYVNKLSGLLSDAIEAKMASPGYAELGDAEKRKVISDLANAFERQVKAFVIRRITEKDEKRGDRLYLETKPASTRAIMREREKKQVQ